MVKFLNETLETIAEERGFGKGQEAAAKRLAALEAELAEEKERADGNYESAERIRHKYSATVNELAAAQAVSAGRLSVLNEKADEAELAAARLVVGALNATLTETRAQLARVRAAVEQVPHSPECLLYGRQYHTACPRHLLDAALAGDARKEKQ